MSPLSFEKIHDRLELSEVMEKQKESYPQLEIPWIVQYLTSEVELLVMKYPSQSFGLFRVGVEPTKLAEMEKHISHDTKKNTEQNPHCAATFLKNWLFHMKSALLNEKEFP